MSRPIAAIAARCLAFAPCTFPQVISKMQRIATDPDCSVPLISSIMISDPMLAALTISRASVGSDAQTGLISGSIAKLGLAAVQGVCLDIEPIPRALRQTMASHWAHANASAQMCRILAQACRSDFPQRGNLECLTIIGLLHDLGNMATRLLFPSEYAAAANLLEEDTTTTFNAALRATLGVCSFHVGALIAKAWHLPDDIRTAIRYHQDPEPAPEHQEVAALCHIAHNLVKGCGFTAGPDIYVENINPASLQVLGLRQQDLIPCIKQYYEQSDELSLYEASFASS